MIETCDNGHNGVMYHRPRVGARRSPEEKETGMDAMHDVVGVVGVKC